MKVLIVDDAGVMRKVITRELVDMGFAAENISEAANGKEGLDKAVATTFDLILMDWNMPEMLGIDSVVAIRAAGVKTPIVMVTTESERGNIVRAIQAGASNYLTKPFNKQDFQSKIQQTVGPGPYIRPKTEDIQAGESLDSAPQEAKKPVFNASSGRLQLG
jgi:two-component system, chemotaxis family, chemotaxis protein CheY